VVAGETWYYRVFAVGSGGESPRSPAVSVTLPADFKPRPRFANAGFEVPDLGDRGETTELSSRWYDLGWNPTGPKNAAGIAARNNSAVAEKAVIPEGKQVGILRGEGGLQQTIDLPAGAWRVSFAVAQRTRDGNKTQAVQVQIDGKVVTIAGAPSVVPAPGSAFTPVVTDAATITAGSHTVLITGMVAGQSACIDDVRIVP
jgi:hypothetical protein